MDDIKRVATTKNKPIESRDESESLACFGVFGLWNENFQRRIGIDNVLFESSYTGVNLLIETLMQEFKVTVTEENVFDNGAEPRLLAFLGKIVSMGFCSTDQNIRVFKQNFFDVLQFRPSYYKASLLLRINLSLNVDIKENFRHLLEISYHPDSDARIEVNGCSKNFRSTKYLLQLKLKEKNQICSYGELTMRILT